MILTNLTRKKAHALAYAIEFAVKHYCGQNVSGQVHLYINQPKYGAFVLDCDAVGEAWEKGSDEPNFSLDFYPKGQVETSDLLPWVETRQFITTRVHDKAPFAHEVQYGTEYTVALFGSWSEYAQVGISMRLTSHEGILKSEAPSYVASAISIALKELTANDLQPFSDACFRIYISLLKKYDSGNLTYNNLMALRSDMAKLFENQLRPDLVGEPVKILG